MTADGAASTSAGGELGQSWWLRLPRAAAVLVEKSLDRGSGSGRATGRREAVGDPVGALTFGHRLADLGAQSVGVQASCRESGAGVGDFDAAGDLELVAAERHDADGHSGRECFLGYSGAAVCDCAGCSGEDRCVG